MDLIRAGLDHYVHRGPTAAKFCTHGVFFGAEFLNRIRRRKDDDTTEAELIVVNTVQEKVVIRDAQSIYRKGFIGPFVLKDSARNVGPRHAAIGTWP